MGDTAFSGLGMLPTLDIFAGLLVFAFAIFLTAALDNYQGLLFFLTLCLPRMVFASIAIKQYYVLYVAYYDNTKCKN